MERCRRRLAWLVAPFAMVLWLAALPAGAQLIAIGNQLFYQDIAGLPDTSEGDDWFGRAVAAGDFDNDGLEDLAIGVPREGFSGLNDAGVVHVLYAAPGGLSVVGNQLWHQDSPGIAGSAESGDWFGFSLAAGDFDNDGFDDLAIGVVTEAVGAQPQAGAVNILYGSSQGLTATGNQLWHQDSPGILDSAEAFDLFGNALTVGDFDDDGYDDLAIGVRGETVNSAQNAGAVHVLYGSSQGLTATGDQFWHQGSPGIQNSPEQFDNFGSALAAGDFNNDGYDDLAIGVPDENVNLVGDAGGVNVIYGGPGGLDAAGDQFWSQASSGIIGSLNADDHFGSALAAGNFDNDGYDDLAVGVPGEDVGTGPFAGAANVIYGWFSGLNSSGNQYWHQDSAGVLDAAEADDRFGSALSTGDFNADGYDDLAIGVSGEDFSSLIDVGAVQVLHGALAGLASAGNQFWHQGTTGILGSAEPNDYFGSALSTGDLDGDGYDDLAVGVYGEAIGALDDAGAVQVLYSSGIFADGFESGNTAPWSATVP